jgi:NAD-dependent dihydropyrimidine dehydrogenase PreA subunit
MVEIKIESSKCDGCGTCKDTCPVSVFEIIEAKSNPINVNDCLACRACEAQCPNSAIQIIE